MSQPFIHPQVFSVLSEVFESLPQEEAEDFFLESSAREQLELLRGLSPERRRSWMRLLPPDDAADLVQLAEPEERKPLLDLLDERTRHELNALLAYAEDEAGGLMNPRFVRVRPDMRVDEAMRYLHLQSQERVTLYYVYVLDGQQRLLGVLSLRRLFRSAADAVVSDVMRSDVVSVRENMDQEAVSALFSRHDLMAVPVLDDDDRMKGIITVDDIVDVLNEEATEDQQKFGGMEALDAPYLEAGIGRMVAKRAGWLTALFLSEMLTTSAMSHYESRIAQAVVLAIFVPLIISSGGNSGSQASTLVIRAMALGEVQIRDLTRVLRRELLTGLALGAILGAVGFCRVLTMALTRFPSPRPSR
jgi:magnesium transporter